MAHGHYNASPAETAMRVKTLEKLVVNKGLGSSRELSQLKDDWTSCTIATPHGQPIELKRTAS